MSETTDGDSEFNHFEWYAIGPFLIPYQSFLPIPYQSSLERSIKTCTTRGIFNLFTNILDAEMIFHEDAIPQLLEYIKIIRQFIKFSGRQSLVIDVSFTYLWERGYCIDAKYVTSLKEKIADCLEKVQDPTCARRLNRIVNE